MNTDEIECPDCEGHGYVADYSSNPMNFGSRDCDRCHGTGMIKKLLEDGR